VQPPEEIGEEDGGLRVSSIIVAAIGICALASACTSLACVLWALVGHRNHKEWASVEEAMPLSYGAAELVQVLRQHNPKWCAEESQDSFGNQCGQSGSRVGAVLLCNKGISSDSHLE